MAKSVRETLSEMKLFLDENNKKEEAQPPKPKTEYDQTINSFVARMNEPEDPLKKFKGEPRLFVRKTAQEWIQYAITLPKSRMLFSELWYEYELCILFSDTNLGKSILATQISYSISTGVPIPGFKLEAEAQPVLYFDFELSPRQFLNRYNSEQHGQYYFHPNLMRLCIDPYVEIPECYSNMEAFTIHSIEREVLETGAKVVVVDNITYLNYDNESARDANPFMKQLHELKNRLEISILVIAHTPKRDRAKPLEVNSVAGSAALVRFTDSIFGIGPSQVDPELRYIKQLKMRDSEHIYHAENVCVCRIEMPENFLGFRFLDYGIEKQHLAEATDNDRKEMMTQAKELAAQGKTQREIADILGIGKSTIARWLK